MEIDIPPQQEVHLWAPRAKKVELLLGDDPPTSVRMMAADKGAAVADGWFGTPFDESWYGKDYWFLLDGQQRRADPASRYQPQGVHGPSHFVRLEHQWRDAQWQGTSLDEYVLYELHVGTFSETGDFAGVAAALDVLSDLGITAIELMPVAQFPGERNWGYDGVFAYAVQNSYGGPVELQRLVDACHQRSIAVVLDVVYNHLGPEGNYLDEFGPYFTERYHTPWGKAINFDGRHSDPVRQFFIENALYWIREFHIDALRLDAIQTIFDNSARPFLKELAEMVHAEGQRLGRRVYLIAETNQNDVRQITPRSQGGWGLDAVWNDDFHHSLHALLTGERVSVYQDHGTIENLAKAYREGFVLSGQYSRNQQKTHGSYSGNVEPHRFVVFAQNHDQIGNRLYGERLTELVSFEQAKLAAAIQLLSPYVPMLFMGEEYAEAAPFLYFVDHYDEGLKARVRAGRLREHRVWLRPDEPAPPPDTPASFRRSRLRFDRRQSGHHAAMWAFHQRLIQLRKRLAPLQTLDRTKHEVQLDEECQWLVSRRWQSDEQTLAVFHFGLDKVKLKLPHALTWDVELDSTAAQWGGSHDSPPELTSSEGGLDLNLRPVSATLLVGSMAV